MIRVRWWTIAVLAWLDLALYLDTALRWQQGLSFIGGARWMAWTIVCVGAWLAAVAWLTLSRAGGLRHAVLAFLAASFGFFIAGTGHPHYDWRSLPFYAGLFEDGSMGVYLHDNGDEMALLAAIFHGAVGFAVKSPPSRLAPWTIERWLGVTGVAVLLSGLLLGSRPIHVSGGVPPAPALVESLRGSVGDVHRGVGAFLMGWSVTASMYRFWWLRRVRRGLVSNYRLERASLPPTEEVAKLWPLPRRWLGGVLFEMTPRGRVPVGLVTALGLREGNRVGEPPVPGESS